MLKTFVFALAFVLVLALSLNSEARPTAPAPAQDPDSRAYQCALARDMLSRGEPKSVRARVVWHSIWGDVLPNQAFVDACPDPEPVPPERVCLLNTGLRTCERELGPGSRAALYCEDAVRTTFLFCLTDSFGDTDDS